MKINSNHLRSKLFILNRKSEFSKSKSDHARCFLDVCDNNFGDKVTMNILLDVGAIWIFGLKISVTKILESQRVS